MHEMRDAVRISSDNFRIRSNHQDTYQREIQQQEKYLSEIENSQQVSPEWHLKKKLTSVLARDKSYNFLISYKGLQILSGGRVQIILDKHVDLSATDKDIILQQIQATYEKLDGEGNYQSLESLELVMPDRTTLMSSTFALDQNNKSETRKKNPAITSGVVLGARQRELPANLWGKVRSKLIDYFGASGNDLDKAWFSRVEANIDNGTRTLSLKAPSSFIQDWIEEKYGDLLERFCRQDNYSLEMRA